MATVKAGLVAALKADAGVSSIVGARVYPSHAPKLAAKPRVIVHLASDERGRTLAGHTNQRVARALMECQADTDLAAETLARAVDAMFTALQLGGSLGGCTVETCLQAAEGDTYADPGDGGDAGTFTRLVDYRIDYRT